MKVVSWNCRGMGSKEKKEDLGKLLHIERPSILLIQETKVREYEFIQEMQRIWRKSKGMAISARGASGGLCTLWSSELFQLEDKPSCFELDPGQANSHPFRYDLSYS
jgi:exonuclease III